MIERLEKALGVMDELIYENGGWDEDEWDDECNEESES